MMVGFTVPYAMNGTELPGEALRRQQQDTAGEGSGVVRAADLKITQMDVPDRGIKIMPGHDLIQCRSSGSDRETYGVQLNAATNWLGDSGLGLEGTGSQGGRRDMIIHEILDDDRAPHFTPKEKWPAGATSKLTIVQGVPATAKTVADVPELANVTCYELAAINWPASTGVVTNAMIEDLRVVHSPRMRDVTFARPRIDSDGDIYLTGLNSNGGEFFPGGGGSPNEFTVLIPAWATHMSLDASWMAVIYDGSKNPRGAYWMEFGDEYRPHTWPNKQQYEFATQKFSFNSPATTDELTAEWRLMDAVPIPAKLRGKMVTFVFKAGRNDAVVTSGPSANNKAVRMTGSGGLGCQIRMTEVAINADTV